MTRLWSAGTATICRTATNSHLELQVAPVILASCRFTNFIVKSASATAKSSSAPATGRGRNARTAVPRKYRRNFPCLPPPMPAATIRHRETAAADIVAAAVATAIEFSILRYALCATARIFERFVNRKSDIVKPAKGSLSRLLQADFRHAHASQIFHRPVRLMPF